MSVSALQKLKVALPDVIGRRISRITVRQHDHYRTQLFLFFDDRTYYEFYSSAEIWGARQLDHGGIESIAPRGEIPTRGALDVVDRETAVIVERPVIPVATAVSETHPDSSGSSTRVRALRSNSYFGLVVALIAQLRTTFRVAVATDRNGGKGE